MTKIDHWFLTKMKNIVDFQERLRTKTVGNVSPEHLLRAKQLGFSDRQIAHALESTEMVVRNRRRGFGIAPRVRQIDTVAAEWPATTNYLYLTYSGDGHDVQLAGVPEVTVMRDHPFTVRAGLPGLRRLKIGRMCNLRRAKMAARTPIG